jgi:ADP-ribose pyrophosphatase
MEKILHRKLAYKGRVLRVEEKEIDFGNGNVATWEVAYAEPREGVSVLAVDAEENIYFVRQFEGGSEKRKLHLVSGGLPAGVAPEQQAVNELEEEIGYTPGKLTFLIATRSNPGYTDAHGYLFLAEELTPHQAPRDEVEDLELVVMPFQEALSKVFSGEIDDQRTILALLLYERLRN